MRPFWKPFSGIISDIPHVKPNHLFTSGMILSGIATVVCPLISGDMIILSVYGVIYTIGSATWASLRTVVMGNQIFNYWHQTFKIQCSAIENDFNRNLYLLRPWPAELFGIEYITDCIGISQMCQGVAAIVGPPIGGFLYEVTGTYQATFVMSGFAMILSGMLEGSLTVLATWERSKKTN